MRNVLLIGLGRFGRHMAQKLSNLHHQVLATLIDSLGVKDFDVCVVTMSHDLQASLEITALLKKKGAPFVLARVSRDAHAQFLLSCGADDVIYPEKQMAEWAAVRYSSEHIFDYVRLSPDHAIYETDIPDSWIGRTVMDLAIRQKYRLNILAVRRGGAVDPMPGPAHAFCRGDRVILLGSENDVQKFLRF